MQNNSFYYDYSKVFSYGKNNIVVVGDRGHGKSYGAKDIGMKYGIKNHCLGLVWIRRYVDDLKLLKPRFLQDWLPNNEELCEKYIFYNEGNYIYCEDKKTNDRWEIVEFIGLSSYEKQKSIPRPFVKYMVYDEFITQGQYLQNECFKIADLRESVFRDRNSYFVIFLANALTICNPVFEGFEIKASDVKKEFTIRNNFVLHYDTYDQEWKKHKRSTTKQMFTGIAYEDYSIDSKFVLDDASGIEEPPKSAVKNFRYNIALSDIIIGVWDINGITYMGDPIMGNGVRTYSPIANECFAKNYQYLDLKNMWWKNQMDSFVNGTLKFKSVKIKNALVEIFLSINRKF